MLLIAFASTEGQTRKIAERAAAIASKLGQNVEIGLVNINTQAARSVVDHQIWKYDEKQKHWWLMTGLPDITRHE